MAKLFVERLELNLRSNRFARREKAFAEIGEGIPDTRARTHRRCRHPEIRRMKNVWNFFIGF